MNREILAYGIYLAIMLCLAMRYDGRVSARDQCKRTLVQRAHIFVEGQVCLGVWLFESMVERIAINLVFQ